MGTWNACEDCCIKWTEHQTLLEDVCTDLLTSEKFSDVTLFCEGKMLKCHKFILAGCSSYFDEILCQVECKRPVIVLRDVSHSDMKCLLHFIYCGQLTISESRLNNIVTLAQSLRIKGIGESQSSPAECTVKKTTTRRKRLKSNDPTCNEAVPAVATTAATAVSRQDATCNVKNDNLKEYFPKVPFTCMDESSPTGERSLYVASDSHQQLMGGTLSPQLDASDYSLQETVEYTFDSDPMQVDQPMNHHQQMLGEYSRQSPTNALRKQHYMESEVEISSDASMSVAPITPVYKQYSEENLLSAIKSVLTDGMKQVDACIKYGIPFTTLTRKIRLYKACGGRLPSVHRRERPRVHHSTGWLKNLDGDSKYESSCLGKASCALPAPDKDPRLCSDASDATDARVDLAIQDRAVAETAGSHNLPAYKQYSEESLKEAIGAVLEGGVRPSDASTQYGIPLTTLSRKIRSFKESLRSKDASTSLSLHKNSM